MEEVLGSVEPVIKQSRQVYINEQAVVEFCKSVVFQDLEGSKLKLFGIRPFA